MGYTEDYVKELNQGYEDERNDPKLKGLFRNYRREPVTADTIKTEAEKPFKDTAQVLAMISKLGIAYQTAVHGDTIRQRYQQFPFRGGDAPLIDVKPIKTKPNYSDIIDNVLARTDKGLLKEGTGVNDPNVYISPQEVARIGLNQPFQSVIDGEINIGPSGKPLQGAGQNPFLTYGERKGITPLPSKKEVIRRQKLGLDWQNESTISPLKSPGEKKREDILSGKREYPSIEEMTLANRPQHSRIYKRPTDLNKKEWDTLGLKLQADHGGSDFDRDTFIKNQRDYLARMKRDQNDLNKQFQFDYLEFANTAIEEGLIDGVSSVEDLYGNKIAINNVDDLVYALYTRMAQDPKKSAIFDIGHVRSARVLADEGQSSADYASNLRLEIRRSIRDWNKGKPLKDLISTGKPSGWEKGDPMIFKHEWKGGKLIEGGNLKRRDLEESPKIVDLMLGTSPNIEVEYQKHLGEFGSAFDEIIPIELQDEYRSFLRKKWRKWQGWGTNKVSGKQQLDLFEKKIRQFTDDFLNKMSEGEVGTKQFKQAKSDAEIDILRDALSGKLGEEKYKATVRRIARWILEGNRDKKSIINNLFPDE